MMKFIACLCLVWFASTATLLGGEKGLETQDITLNYVEVTKAHQVLLERLPAAKGAIVTLHLDANAITILASNPNAVAIRNMLREIDKGPARVLLSMTVAETDDEAGTNERIISRPTIFTFDGKPSTVYVLQKNGKYLQVKVTTKVLESAVAAAVEKDVGDIDLGPGAVLPEKGKR